MYVVVGYCNKCGAPIYTYSTWNSVTPPPSIMTCTCFPQKTYSTSTDYTINIEENNNDKKNKS